MIMVDTHVLVWSVVEPGRLSRTGASAIRRSRRADGLAIASITLWELAALFWRGRLQGRGTVEASIRLILDATGAIVRPITPEIASLAMQFPDSYPKDPADRLIGATARAEGMTLVTHDERIRSSPLLQTVW
jgi:PIN domain nuclease of toxin-antitoxin system